MPQIWPIFGISEGRGMADGCPEICIKAHMGVYGGYGWYPRSIKIMRQPFRTEGMLINIFNKKHTVLPTRQPLIHCVAVPYCADTYKNGSTAYRAATLDEHTVSVLLVSEKNLRSQKCNHSPQKHQCCQQVRHKWWNLHSEDFSLPIYEFLYGLYWFL